MRSGTLIASQTYSGTDFASAKMAFHGLVVELLDRALAQDVTILWDTLMIRSERNQVETGTIFQSEIESYIQWTAEVTTVREVEE